MPFAVAVNVMLKLNLVSRVSLLPAPGGGKKRDPGNEVGSNSLMLVKKKCSLNKAMAHVFEKSRCCFLQNDNFKLPRSVLTIINKLNGLSESLVFYFLVRYTVGGP